MPLRTTSHGQAASSVVASGPARILRDLEGARAEAAGLRLGVERELEVPPPPRSKGSRAKGRRPPAPPPPTPTRPEQPEKDPLPGGQLAAGAGDLAAAGVAHGGVDARRPEPPDELLLDRLGLASHSEPGVGLSGIRLTCTSLPLSRLASRSARHGWSLTSRISAYSIDSRRPVVLT